MLSGRRGTMVAKEFREFFRDPVLLSLVLWLYTIEVVICAVSLTFDLKDVGIGVLDLDRSLASRELVTALDRSPSFEVRYRLHDERESERLLGRGAAVLVAVIPRGYERRLARDGEAEMQLLVDGANPMTA
ncbi:MAG: ABC transporter permease, partial [Gemmatimonadales bacterium]|nr:ABC transporter permease [Gemmatimonadales bacterium]